MCANDGKLHPIRDVFYDPQQKTDASSYDDRLGVLRATDGNEPCEEQTQLKLEAELAVAMRSFA